MVRDWDAPPADVRYIRADRSNQNAAQVAVRADVVSFLNSVYESVAECLPDCRDTEFDGIDPDSIPTCGLEPYCIKLNEEAQNKAKEYIAVTEKTKQQKPRKKRKGVTLNLGRTKEEKWLPPGRMKEYYTQYTVVSSLSKPASFPCFWTVPGLEFLVLISSLCMVLDFQGKDLLPSKWGWLLEWWQTQKEDQHWANSHSKSQPLWGKQIHWENCPPRQFRKTSLQSFLGPQQVGPKNWLL